MKLLVVIDMQTDFVNGALGTKEAEAIVPNVVRKVEQALQSGVTVIFTQDTHREDYLHTLEGKNLPVPHCVWGSEGWQIVPQLQPYTQGCAGIEKPTFGSCELAQYVSKVDVEQIELVGLCTDICVIANALLLKSTVPEVPILVDASCCAGVTPERHQTALEAMKACQITII